MEVAFKATSVGKEDPNFQYDLVKEFKVGSEANEWDSGSDLSEALKGPKATDANITQSVTNKLSDEEISTRKPIISLQHIVNPNLNLNKLE
jgi:hypothetical protein